ncbi:penicillin-binding protein [Candidatus Dojkabacteria bacterium]|uniref:Penicillin-binding protein n=1 Tax=Candidatus Dojkabacteria bacterium TaxID=2099670 RepID=A0A5C7J4Q2_9BACT|nr:MAG: penicillin-binding protein [Candidatus Dojkabacteria bacterium]
MIDYGSRSRRRRTRLKSRRPSRFPISFPKISGGKDGGVVLYSKLAKYALFALIAGIIMMVGVFIWFSRDLPEPGKLVEAQAENSTRIFDRNGEPLYSVYEDVNRSYVKLDEIPKYLQEATISTEDKNFYKNNGFSVTGYIRGLIIDPIIRRRVTGGSTITQQLVKNVLLTSERSLPRKVKELVLAVQVDKRYSKDEILEMYLNDVPYGGTAIGVEAASETYFGKKVKDLNLAESAFLAGLPQSPSTYSPFTGNKYYINRSALVLKNMREQGYITEAQEKKALEDIKKMKFTQRESVSMKAPHFVIYVKQKLAAQFGEAAVENGGLQVKTTLDYKLQKKSEDIVKEEIEKLKGYRVGNGAAVVTDPKTGQVLAMVGSKDYFDVKNDGNFNVAIANRQPGSSLKPIIYATAFQKGYTPATMLMDVKTDFPNGQGGMYVPVNYDGKFRGPTQVRFALGNSLNIPAVKMLAKVGLKDVMEQGYEMGLSNWEPTAKTMQNVGLSLVLGGREVSLLDETTAYGVFADKGVRHDPVTILEVKDNNGKVLYEYKPKDGQKVLSEEISFLISHILLDNNARSDAFGPNSALNIPGVAVKTGTTDEKRDNWTIGYTPNRVVGVWVGNNDNSPMNPAIASGVTGASPIWRQIMLAAMKDAKKEDFQKPDGVVAVQVDSLGGGMPTEGRSTRSEYFVKGTEPTSESAIYKKKDGKVYYWIRESDPVSTDGVNRWQQAIDAWIEQFHKDDPAYHPPGDITGDNKSEPTPTPNP